MKKIERITAKIEASKETTKGINKVSHYEVERFIEDGNRYIKAIKESRMINCIGSVSSSGMSRTIKFLCCEKSKYSGPKYQVHYNYLNFYAFFLALGYSKARSRYEDSYFSIGGCGMDMIFHTNYTNIHRLHKLGFITKKECNTLAQMTPQTI